VHGHTRGGKEGRGRVASLIWQWQKGRKGDRRVSIAGLERGNQQRGEEGGKLLPAINLVTHKEKGKACIYFLRGRERRGYFDFSEREWTITLSIRRSMGEGEVGQSCTGKEREGGDVPSYYSLKKKSLSSFRGKRERKGKDDLLCEKRGEASDRKKRKKRTKKREAVFAASRRGKKEKKKAPLKRVAAILFLGVGKKRKKTNDSLQMRSISLREAKGEKSNLFRPRWQKEREKSPPTKRGKGEKEPYILLARKEGKGRNA